MVSSPQNALPNKIELVFKYLAVVWQTTFFLVPLVLLIVLSFQTLRNYAIISDWNLNNYQVLASPVYVRVIITTIRIALLSSLLSVVLAVPISYQLLFLPLMRRLTLIYLLLVPLVSSYVVTTLAIQQLVGDQGVWVNVMQFLGISDYQFHILYTETATMFGMVSLLLPTSVLIGYVLLSLIDRSQLLAARNLGASRLQIFRFILGKYVLWGVTLSFLFCFITTMGDFVAPTLLGGSQSYTISILLQDRIKIGDWPGAAALTVMVLILLAVLIVILRKFLPGREGEAVK